MDRHQPADDDGAVPAHFGELGPVLPERRVEGRAGDSVHRHRLLRPQHRERELRHAPAAGRHPGGRELLRVEPPGRRSLDEVRLCLPPLAGRIADHLRWRRQHPRPLDRQSGQLHRRRRDRAVQRGGHQARQRLLVHPLRPLAVLERLVQEEQGDDQRGRPLRPAVRHRPRRGDAGQRHPAGPVAGPADTRAPIRVRATTTCRRAAG